MNQIPYQQHTRLFLKSHLMRWRLQRTKSFASNTGRTLEEALLYIKHRCGSMPLSDAVDAVITEMDAVVDQEFHSSNEPLFINQKSHSYGSNKIKQKAG